MDQQNLDYQRQLSGNMMGAANSMLGKYTQSRQPMYSQAGTAKNQKLTNLPALADPSFGAVQEVQDAMMSRMQPDMERARKAQEAQLIAQGVGGNTGGEAWDRSQMMIGRNENDQRQQALLGAMGAYNDIFQRSLANRGQVANEQLGMANVNAGIDTSNAGNQTQSSIANMGNYNTSRELDLQELMGMLGGAQRVTMPSFSNMGETQYMPAGQQQYGAAMDAANAKNAANNSMWGTAGSLAGTALTVW
jgi:hypothetical protein